MVEAANGVLTPRGPFSFVLAAFGQLMIRKVLPKKTLCLHIRMVMMSEVKRKQGDK